MFVGGSNEIGLQCSETFPSGCLTLDFALGGGLPKGRVVEVNIIAFLLWLLIYGPESSGKTTLALHAIAEIQIVGIEDFSQSLDEALRDWNMRKKGCGWKKLATVVQNSSSLLLTTLRLLN
ncbi:hypothetical protein GW17_00002324 [Ensete ventricosum]|nr:hypothetical protein GW17_00002324 [Ensete ventricosum]